MTYHERNNMNRLDRMILEAAPDLLYKLQQLDRQTQLDGKSFYDVCIEAGLDYTAKIKSK